MIEFVTLFLGLVFGPQPVELSVLPPVVTVELYLDSARVTELSGPPWQAELNLGPALIPHRLEAVGLDAQGREVTRIQQLINFGRSNYEATLLLEDDGAGPQRAGRVTWEAIYDQKPLGIGVTFDGEPLRVGRGGEFSLPSYDPSTLHVLEADLLFSGGNRASAVLGVGQHLGSGVMTALTALPVFLAEDAELPAADAMTGWFSAGGSKLSVAAVEHQPGGLLIVMDPPARVPIRRIAQRVRKGELPAPPKNVATDHQLRWVSTRPVARHGGTFQTFQHSGRRKDFLQALWNGPLPVQKRARQRIWDSVAVAGKRVSEESGTRAVLVLLSEEIADSGSLVPPQALGYLASLRVPFFIWAPSGIEPGPRAYVGSRGLLALLTDLETTLARQRIVWLTGSHLPREVEMASQAQSFLQWDQPAGTAAGSR